MTIIQDCQCNEKNDLYSNTLRRIWYLIKRTVNRYKQWKEMKYDHRLLLTKEDRMLKDIGLSRADVFRVSNAHTFMKFVFQSESKRCEKLTRSEQLR